MTVPPVIWWIRRDLRLADNPVLEAVLHAKAPVIPVYIRDGQDDQLGAAPAFRLGLGLEVFSTALAEKSSRLILRQGDALEVLQALVRDTGARAVFWGRLYDPASIARDSAIKDALKADGIDAQSFNARLLFEPWTVETKTGGMFRVYTPFWKSLRGRAVPGLTPAPARLPAPGAWPDSLPVEAVSGADRMRRGGAVVRLYSRVGEDAAGQRLEQFLSETLFDYSALRDVPAEDATSGLSENLAWGEISPQRMWHGAWTLLQQGNAGAETFLKEIVWREFSYHLMYHTPRILDRNWRPEWDSFPWRDGPSDTLKAWRRGQTGYDFVDAAMRELYVTGKMHNRARMVVASFLCKHLMIHWKHGMDWFADCLTDWDPAANAMGWQWAAGSGPDAAPFFRIFNPESQRKNFDPASTYIRRWIAEGQSNPPETALAFFEAAPSSWGLSPHMPRARPMVDLKAGRARALEAYNARKDAP